MRVALLRSAWMRVALLRLAPRRSTPLRSTSTSACFSRHWWAYPDGVVFYVGMGCNNRAEQTGQHNRNYLAYRIRQEIENKGEKIQKVIIVNLKVKQHVHVFEKMLIETYRIENLANKKSEDGITTK